MQIHISEILHKRILVTTKESSYRYSPVTELKVLEASPSGDFLKVMDMDGRKFWKSTCDITLVEILHSLEKPI